MVLALGVGVGTAHAAVSVNIGVNIPAPPQFVVVPGTPVSYAPAVPANYFLYGGRYYVFNNGAWYSARGYNGPWVVVGPQYVPRPLLSVPVRYYHVPPPQWRGWRHDAPPRWQRTWGSDWHDRGYHHDHGRGNNPGGHGNNHDSHGNNHGGHGNHGNDHR